MTESVLAPADLEFVRRRGNSPDVVERQLALCARGPAYLRLQRPCTAGDGIVVFDDDAAASRVQTYDKACGDLDVTKFVPASGAASRMLQAIQAVLDDESIAGRGDLDARARQGDADAAEVVQILDGLNDFAFADELAARTGSANSGAGEDFRRALRTIVEPQGLGYAGLPKALLGFHRYGDLCRTALEEHLVEGAAYAKGKGGVCRLHLTVSPEHRSGFSAWFERNGSVCQDRLATRFEVEYSEQSPASDTPAVDLEDRPFRDAEGQLLFRPGGHGALIENLATVDADLVFIKNIDNVVTESRVALLCYWKKVLAGLALEIQEACFDHLGRLDEDATMTVVDEALAFVVERLQHEPPADPSLRSAFVRDALDRPLRVCGMVRNEGEPGGGPFWVVDASGAVSRQIVESAQIDPTSSDQQALVAAATHFNPVDLVCAVRDRFGRHYPLRERVDADAVFVAEKSSAGAPLKALELPGLWNGAMAGWNTVFVEVPADTFHPVKTLTDLLRPAHRS